MTTVGQQDPFRPYSEMWPNCTFIPLHEEKDVNDEITDKICKRCNTAYKVKDGHDCAPKADVNDRQEGGTHYRTQGNFQHWDWVAQCFMQYHEACATKYVIRKKGNRVEDLKKAVHYIDKVIEMYDNNLYRPDSRRPDFLELSTLCSALGEAYSLSPMQKEICRLLATWHSVTDLQCARALIHLLLQQEQRK